MTVTATRRTFLQTLAVTVAGVRLAKAQAWSAEAPPPKEEGLSSEGLLAGQLGFHPRTAAPLPYTELPGFLSGAQLAAHHAEYVKSVETLKATELALVTVKRDPANLSAYSALRRQQVASANDVLLHDFYFHALTPSKVEVPTYVRRHMNEHMGSFDSWAADFVACAMAAQAWAALIYDPYDDRWHNTVMDSDEAGVWIGGNPLVVCDVGKHAYGTDHQRRDDYVAKFVEHIDWNSVANRYHRVDRM
ncbi:MAG: hypothetical protein HY270_01770 [Deltaproteobacteria bacterium]|nr:hypothetical protein [Deltaproteobacteria bacterium]